MQLDRGVSFSQTSRIRCVLIPVGGISAALFDRYASLLEQCCSNVHLADVTRDPADKTLLQHRKWSATTIHFSFLRDPALLLEDSSLAVTDDLHNELENFQAHKKILCAIGILHCPSSSSPRDDYAAFQKMLQSKYATATVQRCFAMEKNPADVTVASEVMEIPVCDEDKTRFYFQTLMQDFTYAVLRSFEVELARKVAPPFIVTPLDVDLVERVVKAVQLGRLNKRKGDFCLLAGSPADAISFYDSARIESRKQSDWVWLGGALEGYCSALLAIGRDEGEGIACLQEALGNYNKAKAVALEIEGHLRLARWKRERRECAEAAALLMTCHTLGQSLSAQNKVSLLTAVCFEFQCMSMWRKYAFFLRELAQLFEQLHMHGTRERALLLAAPFYQLHELGPPLDSSVQTRLCECPLQQRTGWGLLSALTLLELAKVAEARDDSIGYARYITYVLRLFPGTTSAKTQKDLATLLQNHTRRLLPCVSLDMTGLPLIASVKIIPAQNVAKQPQRRDSVAAASGSGKGVFIFNPSARSNNTGSNSNNASDNGGEQEESVWVLGEVATARLTLVNEREFNIQIERIHLCTRGVAFDAFSTSMNIPAKSAKVVDLSGLPTGTDGKYLVVTGVEIQAFHVLGVHHVDAKGQAILDAPPGSGDSLVPVENVVGPMRVRIADPLPHLFIESVLFSGNHMQILEGVCSRVTVTLENTGKVPIAWIRLVVTENLSSKLGLYAERRTVFSWGNGDSPQDLLAHHQPPLQPGQSHELVVDVFGLVGTIGATFVFQYGSSQSDEFFRKETYHVPIFVTKGLELTSLDVQPCGFDSSELPVCFRLKVDTDIRNKPLCLLLFHVSNSDKAAFYVRPSVKCGDAGFVPLETEETIVCAPGCTRLICLPMPRTWLSDELLEDIPKPPGQFIRVRAEEMLNAEQAHAKKLEYNYKKNLLQRVVKLEWASSNNQCGFLSLANCPVTIGLVRRIMPAPLEISFGGEGLTRVSSGVWQMSVPLMKPLHVCVRIRNVTQHKLMRCKFGLHLLDHPDLDAVEGVLLHVPQSLVATRDVSPGEDCECQFGMTVAMQTPLRFEVRFFGDEDLNQYVISPELLVLASL